MVWWIGLHVLLLAVAALIPGPTVAQVCGALLVALHAAARWPRPTPRVVRSRDGAWAVPAIGLEGLTLGPRTRYTTFWVRLSLVAPTRTLDIVLLVDQLDPQVWRVLQAWLRSGAGRAATASDAASARDSTNLR